eukprot:5647146-Pyramimonas_sp.AAC.1
MGRWRKMRREVPTDRHLHGSYPVAAWRWRGNRMRQVVGRPFVLLLLIMLLDIPGEGVLLDSSAPVVVFKVDVAH